MACLNTITLNHKQNKGQAVNSVSKNVRTRGANVAFVLGHVYISMSCVIDRRNLVYTSIVPFKHPSVRGFKMLEATQFLFKQLVSLFT